MKEICICAAVLTEEGKIIRGHRHCDCIASIFRAKLIPGSGARAQGFITSNNRYVGRNVGAILQQEAGIKSVHTGREVEGLLFSEDLY